MSRRPLLFLSPIHRASRQIGLHLEAALAGVDVGPSEGHLLSYLRSYAPCPLAEIHRVFGLKRSTLTSVLDRLEARGLLVRAPAPGDRRSVTVDLTEAGRALAERVQAPVEALERRILAEVDDDDLRGFRRVLDAVAHATCVQVRPDPPSASLEEAP